MRADARRTWKHRGLGYDDAMVRRAQFALSVLLASGLAGGCHDAAAIVLPAPTGSGGSGASVAGGHDAGVGGQAGSPDYGGSGGAGTPVYLGLTPTPAHPGPGEATAAEQLAAELSVRALGVRARVIAVPWDAVDAVALAALATRIVDAHAVGARVVVDLMLVDRARSLRPGGLAGLPWDAAAVQDALATTSDDLLALGPDALSFGREVDRYLDAHASERDRLSGLLAAAIAHVQASAVAAPTGVSLVYTGAEPPPPSYGLADLGEFAFFSYFPGLDQPTLSAASAPAKGLDAMYAASGGHPVVLERVGATSAEGIGANEQSQKQFYASLFQALAHRRARFPVVNLHELHDLADDACAELAASQGTSPESPYGAFMCGLGLRRTDGSVKAAFVEVTVGLAAFATP